MERKIIKNGIYKVNVLKIELKASKAGKPMVSMMFKIVSDEEKRKSDIIYYNLVISEGFQIHIANELLKDLTERVSEKIEVKFETYSQYSDLLTYIMKKVKNNFIYVLDYKDFNKYKQIKIVKVLDINNNQVVLKKKEKGTKSKEQFKKILFKTMKKKNKKKVR